MVFKKKLATSLSALSSSKLPRSPMSPPKTPMSPQRTPRSPQSPQKLEAFKQVFKKQNEKQRKKKEEGMHKETGDAFGFKMKALKGKKDKMKKPKSGKEAMAMEKQKLKLKHKQKEFKVMREELSQRLSMSAKSGLIMPCKHFYAQLLGDVPRKILVRKVTGVAMAGALEHIMAEVLCKCQQVCQEQNKSRTSPQILNRALKTDPDLVKLFRGTIAGGGVVPETQRL